MIITKSELKILKYVYSKRTVSYKNLKSKFHNHIDLLDVLESLAYHHYLIQVGGHQNNLGSPIPIIDETLFTMDALGSATVENAQWFNTEYIVSHVLIPVVLAVISTLITLFLTSAI